MTIKDSGTRKQYQSGMVRDADNKTEYDRLLDGPMLKRWAEHLTKGAVKYPDLENGRSNWTLANSEQELRRFKQSAFRHFLSWIQGEVDEDHAAGIMFNVNGAEYVRQRLNTAEYQKLVTSYEADLKSVVSYEDDLEIDYDGPTLDENWQDRC